jgi:hypothetical protein
MQAVAFAMHAGGLCVLPVDHHTKKPLLASWTALQKQRPDEGTLRSYFRSKVGAIAAICGAVSGGLVVLDFDVARFYDLWRQAVGALADGLPTQRTGGGGYQVWFRCSSPCANLKLAWAASDQM